MCEGLIDDGFVKFLSCRNHSLCAVGICHNRQPFLVENHKCSVPSCGVENNFSDRKTTISTKVDDFGFDFRNRNAPAARRGGAHSLKVVRWRFLIGAPGKKVASSKILTSYLAGQMLNILFPARVGEISRELADAGFEQAEFLTQPEPHPNGGFAAEFLVRSARR